MKCMQTFSTQVYDQTGIVTLIHPSTCGGHLLYFATVARGSTVPVHYLLLVQLRVNRIVLRTDHCVTVQFAGLYCPA